MDLDVLFSHLQMIVLLISCQSPAAGKVLEKFNIFLVNAIFWVNIKFNVGNAIALFQHRGMLMKDGHS